ncbi:MAG: leucyl aminopeptidase family protein [Planctomycetes bacterium]|nr:leucyl aminopeptidase family protein [Planctomycetota bacterium]
MYQNIRARRGAKPCTLIFLFDGDKSIRGSKHAAAVAAALAHPGFRADNGEAVSAGKNILALGLGERKSFSATSMRIAGARLAKTLARMKVGALEVEVPAGIDRRHTSPGTLGQSFAEGISLAAWRFDDFDGKATKKTKKLPSLDLHSSDKAFLAGMSRGVTIASAVNAARAMAATPPNICLPDWVAQQAKKLGRTSGLRTRVIGFKEAQKLGMGGIVNVGKASASKPCLIMLEHKPRTIAPRSRNQHIVLVGKTITYDTGGYSLKVNNGMKGMKYDKCGGMAVIGAMRAIAALKLPIHVTGVLPTAENMVGGDSYRPDDIITMHNGVTVEVTNTDAEGRLVLADALSYACRTMKPTAIIDLATLTGGVVVALGHFSAGLFCENEPLRRKVEEAAAAAGEAVWRLPLWKEHRDFMRGQHADLINSNPQRSAHPIQGAAFLSFFVDEKMPWCHLDIAGMANTESNQDLGAAGPTGWGVRTLVELLSRWSGVS